MICRIREDIRFIDLFRILVIINILESGSVFLIWFVLVLLIFSFGCIVFSRLFLRSK